MIPGYHCGAVNGQLLQESHLAGSRLHRTRHHVENPGAGRGPHGSGWWPPVGVVLYKLWKWCFFTSPGCAVLIDVDFTENSPRIAWIWWHPENISWGWDLKMVMESMGRATHSEVAMAIGPSLSFFEAVRIHPSKSMSYNVNPGLINPVYGCLIGRVPFMYLILWLFRGYPLINEPWFINPGWH